MQNCHEFQGASLTTETFYSIQPWVYFHFSDKFKISMYNKILGCHWPYQNRALFKYYCNFLSKLNGRSEPPSPGHCDHILLNIKDILLLCADNFITKHFLYSEALLLHYMLTGIFFLKICHSKSNCIRLNGFSCSYNFPVYFILCTTVP